jgi:hypothetical protein
MSMEENKAIIRILIEAFNKRNPALLDLTLGECGDLVAFHRLCFGSRCRRPVGCRARDRDEGEGSGGNNGVAHVARVWSHNWIIGTRIKPSESLDIEVLIYD